MCLTYECCCCFPLTSGLIAWGYIKLVSILIFIIGCTTTRFEYYGVDYTGKDYRVFLDARAMNAPLPIISLVLETGFTILLVVSAHMKHIMLYQIYLGYSAVRLLVIAIGSIVMIVALAYGWAGYDRSWIFMYGLLAAGIGMGIHIYFFSLEKSVLYKFKGRLHRPPPAAVAAPMANQSVNQNVVVNTISQPAPQPVIQPLMQPVVAQPFLQPVQAAYPGTCNLPGVSFPPNSAAATGIQNDGANPQRPTMVPPQPPQETAHSMNSPQSSPPPYDFKSPLTTKNY